MEARYSNITSGKMLLTTLLILKTYCFRKWVHPNSELVNTYFLCESG